MTEDWIKLLWDRIPEIRTRHINREWFFAMLREYKGDRDLRYRCRNFTLIVHPDSTFDIDGNDGHYGTNKKHA